MLYQWATDSAQINEFTIYMPVSSFLKTHYGTTIFYDQYFSKFPFSTSTPLGGWQEGHLTCTRWVTVCWWQLELKDKQSSSQIITNTELLPAGCPSCHPTNSDKALKGISPICVIMPNLAAVCQMVAAYTIYKYSPALDGLQYQIWQICTNGLSLYMLTLPRWPKVNHSMNITVLR